MNISDSKKFWEKCDTTFAHITPNKWLRNRSDLIKSFGKKYGPFDLSNQTIIDYGIGGAFQGIYLLENLNIKKYIGIDIAKRSLDAAKENLKKYDSYRVTLLRAPVEFKQFKADVFTSFAVIQHFPNQEYLDDFLNNINRSGIPKLILQIRYSKNNKFSGSCKTQDDVMLGCQTSKEYMLSKLIKYKCVKEGNIHEGSNYQYLYFTKK